VNVNPGLFRLRGCVKKIFTSDPHTTQFKKIIR
jgi:hypothetical protein